MDFLGQENWINLSNIWSGIFFLARSINLNVWHNIINKLNEYGMIKGIIINHTHIKVLVVAWGDHLYCFLEWSICPEHLCKNKRNMKRKQQLNRNHHHWLHYPQLEGKNCSLGQWTSMCEQETLDQWKDNSGWTGGRLKPITAPVAWWRQRWWWCCSYLPWNQQPDILICQDFRDLASRWAMMLKARGCISSSILVSMMGSTIEHLKKCKGNESLMISHRSSSININPYWAL